MANPTQVLIGITARVNAGAAIAAAGVADANLMADAPPGIGYSRRTESSRRRFDAH
jgi:hypothetical protein